MLLVSGQPVPFKRLNQVVEELDAQTVRRLLDELNQEYREHQHAFQIQEIAGGFQLVTDSKLAPWIKRGFQLPGLDILSKPAMETIAIIAYRQPITKAEIETIRGVDVGGTLETLLERQFVRVAGRKDTPGRPLLYETTQEFLRHFGLKSLKELPPMAPAGVLPGEGEAPLLVPPPAPASQPQQEIGPRDPAAVAQAD